VAPTPRREQPQLRIEYQRNPVADDVSALFAVVAPILQGLLYGLKADVVAEAGGREQVKLKMLPHACGGRVTATWVSASNTRSATRCSVAISW
jgi:hypothetical protein